MKTSLFGGRSLKLVTRRRRQVEILSSPLKLFIAGEYLTVAATPPSSSSISVAQTMPAPVQSGALQTVMPVTVAQVAPAPAQAITAEAPATFEVNVVQEAPAPSQSATVEAQGGAKPKPGGNAGYSYYPPIYAIRTNGHQESPAPGQSVQVQYVPARIVPEPEPVQATYSLGGVEYTLVPAQSAVLKSHRAVKNRDREDREILTLLASL